MSGIIRGRIRCWTACALRAGVGENETMSAKDMTVKVRHLTLIEDLAELEQEISCLAEFRSESDHPKRPERLRTIRDEIKAARVRVRSSLNVWESLS